VIVVVAVGPLDEAVEMKVSLAEELLRHRALRVKKEVSEALGVANPYTTSLASPAGYAAARPAPRAETLDHGTHRETGTGCSRRAVIDRVFGNEDLRRARLPPPENQAASPSGLARTTVSPSRSLSHRSR
jgi:hypothetical protein